MNPRVARSLLVVAAFALAAVLSVAELRIPWTEDVGGG
jgi:hypothetical protein